MSIVILPVHTGPIYIKKNELEKYLADLSKNVRTNGIIVPSILLILQLFCLFATVYGNPGNPLFISVLCLLSVLSTFVLLIFAIVRKNILNSNEINKLAKSEEELVTISPKKLINQSHQIILWGSYFSTLVSILLVVLSVFYK